MNMESGKAFVGDLCATILSYLQMGGQVIKTYGSKALTGIMDWWHGRSSGGGMQEEFSGQAPQRYAHRGQRTAQVEPEMLERGGYEGARDGFDYGGNEPAYDSAPPRARPQQKGRY